MDLINEKKEEIINIATYLFSKRGYMSTSVQDIAKACNISKATIYKCFNSKEDILIEIIKSFNNQMMRLIGEVDLNKELSPMDKYEEKIYVLFKHFSVDREFSLMMAQNESIKKEESVRSIILSNKIYMTNQLKDILIEAYGESIKSIVWDITLCLKGMIKEFVVIFAIREIATGNYRDIAKFIVSSTTALINKHKEDKPLIPLDITEAFTKNDKFNLDLEYLRKEWRFKIAKIKSIVVTSSSVMDREKVLEAITLLELEGLKENSNKVIIEALIMYISNNEELKEHANYLKHIWNGIKTKG